MLITNFASGELSQNLNGRVDIQQYYQGAARIENFEIVPTGGIKRRPGTKRLALLSDNNRIIPFIVDKNSVYILELGLNPSYDEETEGSQQGLINVWKEGLSGYTVIQTLYCDYASLAAIKEIQFAQNYDTLILVHRDYVPLILKMSAGVFTLSEMQFDFIPDVELDDDFDYIMIPYGSFPTKQTTSDGHGQFSYSTLVNGVTTTVIKDFNSGITDFYCIKDGKLYKWNDHWEVYGTDPDIDDEVFTEANKRPSCVAFFNNRLFFACTGEKPQMVYASAAPDSYGTRYNDFATYKKYVTVNKVTKDADLHLFTCDIVKANIDTENHVTVLTSVTQNFAQSGNLKADVTDYYVSSDIIPIGTKVLAVTENTVTINTDNIAVTWDEEETEKTNLVMSIQLWRSVDSVSAEDYDYMVVANNITTADCSLFFELASDQNDAIKFLSSNRFLAIGTESSIWSVDPGINALSVNAVMQGRYGSDSIQGQAVETATVYFAQGNKGIREFYYDGQSEAFRTNNIALLADHILRESQIVDFDYMTNPYSRLLLVREDGILAEMLYDKTNGIMAWSRIIHGKGKVRNCAVTRGYDENDLVFLVVEDNNSYYLELLDLGDEVYLDSRQLYTEGITGYSTDAVLFNVTKNLTCPSDNIPSDFIAEGDLVYIGYLYTSYIKSMPVVGRDVSKQQKINALLVRFLNSYKPVMKCTGLPDEKFNNIRTVPYSGVSKVTYPGITDYDVCFELEAKETEPVNILSVDAQV